MNVRSGADISHTLLYRSLFLVDFGRTSVRRKILCWYEKCTNTTVNFPSSYVRRNWLLVGYVFSLHVSCQGLLRLIHNVWNVHQCAFHRHRYYVTTFCFVSCCCSFGYCIKRILFFFLSFVCFIFSHFTFSHMPNVLIYMCKVSTVKWSCVEQKNVSNVQSHRCDTIMK